MKLQPIGVIRTPYLALTDMPIQPSGAAGVEGCIELREDLVEGLQGLDGFSHIIVIYQFHQAAGFRLTVTPFLDQKPHGVFATRAPTRPNPIGLSVLKLTGVEGARLFVEQVDMLNGTPLLDIKPYVPGFDRPEGKIRVGWLEKIIASVTSTRSDGRFS
jgi:tRNA-Thr(GGU) m(6)t(6)A37 methyltransferase TsaA